MKSITEKSPPTKDKRCGTPAGYTAHWRRNEKSCLLCLSERRTRQVAWRSNNYEQDRDTNRRWNRNNNEKRRAIDKKYRKENIGKAIVASAKWKRENSERVKIISREWRKKNPECFRIAGHRRRARKFASRHEPYTEAQVLEKYGINCHLCHEPIDLIAPRKSGVKGWERGLHIEHKVALANGGADDLENARPSHGLCNLKKHCK